MAENKKSFILYADLIHTVAKMPKEKAGELFMTILQYVNDLNPVIDDMLIDIVFEPIKQQMRRDLVKWDGIKEKRSQAGKASAEARKAIREFDQMLTESTSVESAEQESANPTVNVNDNVNVTVNVNDNVINNKKGVDKKSVLKKTAPPTLEGFQEKARISFAKHPNSFGPKFKTLWFELIQMKKWRRKSQSALDMSLKMIIDYDEPFASALVKKAIAGDYQGIAWEDTPINYEKYLKQTNGTNNTPAGKAESVSNFMELARQILSGDQAEGGN